MTLTNAACGIYAPEGYARAIADRVNTAGYGAVVFAASATGKDLAPRVAARLGRPLVQDITDVSVQGGAVTAIRPVYAGKALLKCQKSADKAGVSFASKARGAFAKCADAVMNCAQLKPTQKCVDGAAKTCTAIGGRSAS